MGRMGRAARSLGSIMMIGLTLSACATPRGGASLAEPPPDARGPAEITHRCKDFAKSFGYAEKTVGGRVAASAILTPLMIGVGVGAAALGNVQGLGLAVMGPIAMGRWTAKAAQDNKDQFDRLQKACEEGGGPDTVVAARAVRDLAGVRERERSTADATRLYRDTLKILDRADAGESEDAALAALSLASLVEKKAPADPEIAPLYIRAIRIREVERDTRPRDLASVLSQYGRWLRTAGQTQDAEAAEARADALNREATAAEERAPATADAAQRSASITDIVVGEHCAQGEVIALDQLNQELAAQGGMARIQAVDCGEAGQIHAVRLTTPAGATDALTFDTHEINPAATIRAALFTTGP